MTAIIEHITGKKTEVRGGEFWFFLLGPVLAMLAGLGVWYNHFESTYHFDDSHIVVDNLAIRELGNIPRFFTTPRLSADRREFAQYRPLLTTTYALDYHVTNGAVAQVAQIDTFFWFLFQVAVTALFFALIPGVSRVVAMVAAALFALHPIATNTVNYASRRGSIMGALGIAAGMAIWIYYPRRLPARLIYFDGVPKVWWDEFRRMKGPGINAWYQKIVQFPICLYLFPVGLGLLADSQTAAFAPILLAFMLLFDRERIQKRILPATILCGVYWIVTSVVAFRFSAGLRQPAFGYFVTQPLVIVRSLFRFFVPIHLGIVSDLAPADHFWSPLAILGYGGLALIVWAGLETAKREKWRVVSFGIWWFLIAMFFASVIPQHSVEAPERAYIAGAGLALAAVQAVWIAIESLVGARAGRTSVLVTAGGAAVLVLGACGVGTYTRNSAWTSEIRLAEDATISSPRSGIAFVKYARALLGAGATTDAYQNLQTAASLVPDDAADQVELAQAFDVMNKEPQAEEHFKRAIGSGLQYSLAYSMYAQWLVVHQRLGEAFNLATRAVAMNPWDMDARHVLMDIYSQASNWRDVLRVADEALAFDPNDITAMHARELAQSVFDRLTTAEKASTNSTDVNTYLKLSVAYYENRRFEDSVNACRKALAIQPNLVEAYSNMAAADYALGKYDDSAAALTAALKIRPDFQLARKNLDFLEWRKTQKTDPPGSNAPGIAR